ncbi:L,D-transpeptidase [Dysgonomonas sp. BGC7]|uniref:L,D-transpeptidase n=1 Tax=Dysgonomonas sp. BGC7 TaxID=1658008 RepID=UPI00068230B2|nr:L,D-transpeptidase [Dysgonomonas sp. BGC7]MBD8389508.1 L,D-transpeptidase family protein [Dysgonomonas sp. BGC7]
MKKSIVVLFFLACLFIILSCSDKENSREEIPNQIKADSLSETVETKKAVTASDIQIEKQLLYDQYTLDDTYPYKDTVRSFQWDKVKERLAYLENIQQEPTEWALLQNYKNLNGEAPLVKTYKRNEYKRIADTLGVERYQSIPLFLPEDSLIGVRYARDGSLVKILDNDSLSKFVEIETTDIGGNWLVPRKYIKRLADSVTFNKAIVVDRNNENITVLEKVGSKWLIRSMNPVTTGLHKPPHQQETPLGMFVIQERKYKMFFLVDGTTETGGFAPYACRFTNGGYLHGIPVNAPRTTFIEYSPSLGTTPRSHMCVRNATSHAKFIYDWVTVGGTIVFVIE